MRKFKLDILKNLPNAGKSQILDVLHTAYETLSTALSVEWDRIELESLRLPKSHCSLFFIIILHKSILCPSLNF
jgi:hypothetical protein